MHMVQYATNPFVLQVWQEVLETMAVFSGCGCCLRPPVQCWGKGGTKGDQV